MQENWVIQMEGFLLKRGAGYVKEDKSKKKLSFFFPKRRGTLIRKGTAEKKRYFYLLTMAPDKENPPRVELRYFTSKKSYDAPPKGVVEFKSGMQVDLIGHSTICLITQGRTYYLRPDKAAGDPSSAQARTTAGKWIHSFDFAINGLKAWELAGTNEVSEAMHPVMRMSTKLSAEDIEVQRKRLMEAYRGRRQTETEERKSEGEDEEEGKKRNSSQENRAKLQNTAEAFEKMWDRFGLHGYNAVIAHFGPVQIDLKRMEDHLKVKCKLVEAELVLFQKQNYKSQDIAANEQQTTAKVLQALHESLVRREGRAVTHLEKLEHEVVEPISQMMLKIDSELDSIVKFHESTTKNIERLYKGVSELTENIHELQLAYKNSVPSATKERGGKSFMGRAKANSFAIDDPAEIAKELESNRELLADCKSALRTEEVKHASRMKMALRSLHSLEIERLNKQNQALVKLGELENVVFQVAERYFDESSEIMAAINSVDPASDVQATSDRLRQEIRSF